VWIGVNRDGDCLLIGFDVQEACTSYPLSFGCLVFRFDNKTKTPNFTEMRTKAKLKNQNTDISVRFSLFFISVKNTQPYG
jgi:hypothetical protein